MNTQITIVPGEDISALRSRELLLGAKLVTIALIGPPGAGKTTLLEETVRQLRGKAKVAVIVANPAAERDADRISRYCDHVESVWTASPNASELFPALERVDLARTEYLFIESLGGIGGTPDFGQDVTVSVFAVSGGDDKAAEYASLVHSSRAVILTKAELHPHVTFNREAFRADVERINRGAELMEVSVFHKTGFQAWLGWLDRMRREKDPSFRATQSQTLRAEWFVG